MTPHAESGSQESSLGIRAEELGAASVPLCGGDAARNAQVRSWLGLAQQDATFRIYPTPASFSSATAAAASLVTTPFDLPMSRVCCSSMVHLPVIPERNSGFGSP